MNVSRPSFHWVFYWLSAGALIAAAYHGAGFFGMLANKAYPHWRHGLFVGIDLVLACYLLRRPIWGLPVFLILAVQQTGSHGGHLIRSWTELGQFDWISIIDLTGIYLGLALLVLDARNRSPLVRRIVCPLTPA
jgi:hypothetical protein